VSIPSVNVSEDSIPRAPETLGRRVVDVAGVAVLGLGTVASLAMVPAAEWGRLTSPTTLAIYGLVLSVLALAWARLRARPRYERWILAAFLGAMPVVYMAAVLTGGSPSATTVAVELVGVVVFVGVAVIGYSRPPLLAAGIVAHGVCWDLWHVGAHGAIGDWYALACALVDVCLGAYAASRLRAWSKR